MRNFLFELCAESVWAAQAAEFGGADRIELCSELSIGGVTPAPDLIAATLRAVSIPVHVLIRPRGGDFVFSSAEFDQMQHQIERAKQAGAGGVVIGTLLPDGRVDLERTRELVSLARPLSVTFHRAFDETPDLGEALEAVIATGADCLLTSGGAPDLLAGAESIARLRSQASGRLQIMAGGGLRLTNLVEVLRRTGVSSLHGSLNPMREECGESSGEHAGNWSQTKSRQEMLEADVREVVGLLRQEIRATESATRTSR